MLYWSKTYEIKNKYKVNLYFTFKIINIDFFFLLFLNPLFHYSNLRKVFNWPCELTQSACIKTCFSFKIKDRIILFQLPGILKNNLRLFKLDSKTLFACHNSVTSTKWRGKPVLAQIVTAQWKSFPKSHFSSFVIKQCCDSWELRCVNSTILSNKIWLTLISYLVFMSTLLVFVNEKVINFLISWKLTMAVQIARIWKWNQNIWQKVMYS